MIRKINEYDNEVVVARVAKVEVDDKKVKLSLVENYDERRENVPVNWLNVAAFDKTAESLRKLNDKQYLKGAIIMATIRVSQNGDYENRNINSFKVVVFPKKKEE